MAAESRWLGCVTHALNKGAGDLHQVNVREKTSAVWGEGAGEGFQAMPWLPQSPAKPPHLVGLSFQLLTNPRAAWSWDRTPCANACHCRCGVRAPLRPARPECSPVHGSQPRPPFGLLRATVSRFPKKQVSRRSAP